MCMRCDDVTRTAQLLDDISDYTAAVDRPDREFADVLGWALATAYFQAVQKDAGYPPAGHGYPS